MQTRIQGTTMPVLDVQLDPNESVFSESGELSWMTALHPDDYPHADGRRRRTVWCPQARSRRRKPLHDGVSRHAVSRRGLFCDQGSRPHCAGPGWSGTGIPRASPRILCAPRRRSRLASDSSSRLARASFGGSGFLLQRIAGHGTAWLELSGELIMKNLAPGEMLLVHPGHVGPFRHRSGFRSRPFPASRT